MPHDRTTPEEAVPLPLRATRAAPRARARPGPVGVPGFLALQRAAGNRATALAVQRAADPKEGLWSADTDRLMATKKAQTGKKKVWSGEAVSFSPGFKGKLINDKWLNSKVLVTDRSHTKEAVRTFHDDPHVGNWLPLTAFQIDHILPWDKIKSSLWEIAKWADRNGGDIKSWKETIKKEKRGITFEELFLDTGKYGWYPTLFAAKMYYHNVENLQPMEGSLNAAKGASRDEALKEYVDKIAEVGDDQLVLEKRLTRYYLTLLHHVQTIGHHGRGEHDKQAWEKLEHLLETMSDTADDLKVLHTEARSGSGTATPKSKKWIREPIDTPSTPKQLRRTLRPPSSDATAALGENHELNTAFYGHSDSEERESSSESD
ncbi:hypothetical protein Q5530_05070 [Saccharothrix sp. BKS2]|uniref:hypothetical protein n=1 Tax=Saccharothrix sp. BKS2 TaxID=3064400 RepID=UPI0039ED71AD